MQPNLFSQAIIIASPNKAKVQSQRGCEPVLDQVLPQLSHLICSPQKTLRYIKPSDAFMQQETIMLLDAFQYKCEKLSIKENVLALSHQQQLTLDKGELSQNRDLLTCIKQDKHFMGLLDWLQPNYVALANAQEWQHFAESYAISRQLASQRFKHLQQQHSGLTFYLRKQASHTVLLLESPINLFTVLN